MNELSHNQNNKPVTTGHWMLTTFLAGLPIAGFILKLIWAFGKGHHPSKSNWAKAKLIWSIPIAILFIVVLLSAISIPTYFALTENAYSKEAEIQIRNLEKSAGQYYLENGELPYDCWEDMESMDYIEVKQSVIDSWWFECDWYFDDDTRGIVGTITATSTEENGLGPGKSIHYDIEYGEFTGYGQGNSY